VVPVKVVEVKPAVKRQFTGTRSVPGRLGDLEMARDFLERLALAQEVLALGEQPDDLLWTVAASFHVVESSILPILGIGLAQHVDQLRGIRSATPSS
jgi:hypothetical protein